MRVQLVILQLTSGSLGVSWEPGPGKLRSSDEGPALRELQSTEETDM